MDWKTVKKLDGTPFFHFASIVVIGVPLLAQLYLSVRPHLPGLKFPQALVIGFSASVFFVFSKVVYHHYCPEAVKEYRSAEAYASAQQKTYELSQVARKLNVVLANLVETEDDVMSKMVQLMQAGSTVALDTKVDALYPTAIQRFLLKKYEGENHKRKRAMWVAASLYGIGALLALYIMGERFVAVYRAAKS